MNLSVGETSPKPFGFYPLISQKLRDRYRLHAFRSGGGLRVVYFVADSAGHRKPGDPGYGEHPYIEQAFDLCEADLAAGGRKYEDVYGEIVPHFLTGCSTPSSEVDRWVLSGRSFDIVWNDEFIFCGEHYESAIPASVWEEVKAEKKSRIHVDERGFEFYLQYHKDGFVSGKIVCPTDDDYKKMRQNAGLRYRDPYEIRREVMIRSDTLENLLAKMEAEFPQYWEK